VTAEQLDRYKRKHRFKPCKTKVDLHRWIKVFLELDMPDSIVDPDSNSSPMDMIWEVYNTAIWQNENLIQQMLASADAKQPQFMFYSARAAFKTLSAAILELLMLVHAKRSVVHMAAIEDQAKKCQHYVKGFFSKPYFRDFIVGDNQRTIQMVRYERRGSRSEENLTQKEWGQLPVVEQEKYDALDQQMEIAVCTMQGTNSKHSTFMVVDEVDVVANERAYKESKNIPDSANGQMPITVYISTRKTSTGLVQREIDESNDTGLQIRHWNIIDVTAACPPERHRPDLKKLPIYRSDSELKAISEGAYENLIPADQEKYVEDEGFNGCLNNCRMFAVCRGRLATNQHSTSKLLKPVTATQGAFRKFSGDADMAKAQLMCWRPSSEGLIYSRLDADIHMITAAEIAEKITGDKFPANFSKEELIKLFQARQIRVQSGMDFGFTHNFSVVTGAIDGHRGFVFDVIEVPQLELPQQVSQCKQKLLGWNPEVWPDMASPQNIKAFARAGFRMRKWKKGADSVIGGIEIVRMKLRPVMGEPELYFLRGDEGVASLFKKLQAYHWKVDAAGRVMNEPDKVDDDSCDAMRYMVMNVFSPKGRFRAGREVESSMIKSFEAPKTPEEQKAFNGRLWGQQVMAHVLGEGAGARHVGLMDDSMDEGSGSTGGIKKKGKFFFSM